MKTVFALLAVAALVCSAGVVQADGCWNGGYGAPDQRNLTDDGSVPYGAVDKHNYGAVDKHNYGAEEGICLGGDWNGGYGAPEKSCLNGGKGCPFNYMDGDKV